MPTTWPWKRPTSDSKNMQVIHNVGTLNIKRQVNENAGFLLSNNKGSYCSFFSEPSSRYFGLFFFDIAEMSMYKFIDSIEVIGNENITELRNSLYLVERTGKNAKEKFMMPSDYNSLIYELDKENEIDIIMDCKNSYDNRQFGRHYRIYEEKSCIVIEFSKRTDSREDPTNNAAEFTLFLAIKSNNPAYKKSDRWIERQYWCDEKRNSGPFMRYVYNALRIKGGKFIFSMSKNKRKAIAECSHIYRNFEQIKREEGKKFHNFFGLRPIKKILVDKKINEETKMAYINSIYSLKKLIVTNGSKSGVFAGLPWFFQFWARDTIISLKSISRIDTKLSGKILMNYLGCIDESGRLPNTSKSSTDSLGSADAHGWLFYRFSEFLTGKKTTDKKTKYILEKSVSRLLSSHIKENFEFNSEKETWMDTDFGNDSRSGIRIEIQCLLLNIYKLMFGITKNQKYNILKNLLNDAVRRSFWDGKCLADGINDKTIRPNIFIAAYVYRELLSDKEWETCFENSLKSLWLDWGGLSTIDKNNQLFTNMCSGENVRSYHRGDSWFWINNLAALVMNKIDQKKFNNYINKILEASTEEILWKGCVGCHSEISSARQLSSEGCFNQAWSNAMYVEMVEMMCFKK